MPHDDDLADRLTLTASDCERLTGIAERTYLYWAWHDRDCEPEDRIGPPSFLAGRRRLWMRDKLLQWLEDREREADDHVASSAK